MEAMLALTSSCPAKHQHVPPLQTKGHVHRDDEPPAPTTYAQPHITRAGQDKNVGIAPRSSRKKWYAGVASLKCSDWIH